MTLGLTGLPWCRIAQGSGIALLLSVSPVQAAAPSPADLATPVFPQTKAAGSFPHSEPAAIPAPAVRIASIARRLLIAQAPDCAEQESDFGLIAAPPTASSWGAPIAVIWPDGPAARAGLRPGELIRAVDGVPWSADAAERARFHQALVAAPRAADVVLTIERGDERRTIRVTGQARCRADVRLSPRPFINATAVAGAVVIGGGIERLLRDDAELAFAVAHEAAHVILGHTAPERRTGIALRDQRRAMEQEADALAVRMMAAAGYAPDAAARAWAKIADAGRAPLLRLLDIHGPYPATRERTAFLAAAAARLTPPRQPAGSHAR